MLPKASVAKPATPAYTMRPKPNVGSFTEDLAKVEKKTRSLTDLEI